MNFLQGYESDESDENEKLAIDNSNINDNNDNDDNNNDNDEDRTRVERATRKRIKLRNDAAELPDDFFVATPGTNDDATVADRPKQTLPAVIRPLIPPQLARRRANKSTEDDAVRYGVSGAKKK
jgi:hypothetical protein